jgi:hypothetical protein
MGVTSVIERVTIIIRGSRFAALRLAWFERSLRVGGSRFAARGSRFAVRGSLLAPGGWLLAAGANHELQE